MIFVGLRRKGDGEQHGDLPSVEAHEFGLPFVEPFSLRECDQRFEETAIVLTQQLVHVLDEGRRAARSRHLLQGGIDVDDCGELAGMPDEIGISCQISAQIRRSGR